VALDNLGDWVSRARAATQRVVEPFEERMGYKPDIQETRLVSGDTDHDLSELPDPARAFFSTVDEISWPDIWNGYFLGPASETSWRFRNQDPGSVVVGSEQHRSLAIGSDGGGAYFVLDLDAGGTVLHISEATVQDGVLRGITKEVAPDLNVFLERLIENVLMVARGHAPKF
jgi:hypothetical protein